MDASRQATVFHVHGYAAIVIGASLVCILASLSGCKTNEPKPPKARALTPPAYTGNPPRSSPAKPPTGPKFATTEPTSGPAVTVTPLAPTPSAVSTNSSVSNTATLGRAVQTGSSVRTSQQTVGPGAAGGAVTGLG